MKNIVKEFSGVRALNGVSFDVMQGEIHALCGENGAGKSTLMKVLSGVYSFGNYSGEIILNGTIQKFKNIADSEKQGIAIIAQELALVPEMSVAENIFLGKEIKSRGIIDHYETIKQAQTWLQKLNVGISPRTLVKDLGIGHQQLVEIAKALSKNATLLILDEPTAALTEKESEQLLNILLDLKSHGITSIIISHKLKEVLKVADNITVLRDGTSVCTLNRSEATESLLVSKMVGRPASELFNRKHFEKGEILFETENLCAFDAIEKDKMIVKHASIHVSRNEVVGIAGLMGAGRTELAQAVFGVWNGKVTGRVKMEGKEVVIKNPADAIKNKMALLSEDRKKFGLHLNESISKNISLVGLKKFIESGMIQKLKEKISAQHYKDELKIKAVSVEQQVGSLSGGNQQKVVLAKWLQTEPVFLILDEPTRGIDIGAKAEIYYLMQQLAQKGTGILMISSELPELLGICDRIYVMHEGAIVNCFNADEATQEKIMQAAVGNVAVENQE